MNQVESPPPALSRSKLIMIIVLAIVLVVVLVVQFSGPTDAIPVKRRTSRSAGPSQATAESAGQNPATTTPQFRVHWPEIQRDEVSAFNPFEIPAELQPPAAPSSQSIQIVQSGRGASAQATGPDASAPSPKAEDEQARLRAIERKSRLERIRATASDLQKHGVDLVVRTSTGAIARIGEQEVRVGDVINGVLRIVAIDSQGIVVEEAPPEPNVGEVK